MVPIVCLPMFTYVYLPCTNERKTDVIFYHIDFQKDAKFDAYVVWLGILFILCIDLYSKALNKRNYTFSCIESEVNIIIHILEQKIRTLGSYFHFFQSETITKIEDHLVILEKTIDAIFTEVRIYAHYYIWNSEKLKTQM